MSEIRETTTASDGTRILLRRRVPDEAKASVVLVHGLGDHSGRYPHLADALENDGYAVLSLDLRGHGESAGRRVHLRRFDDYLMDLHAALAHWHAEDVLGRIILLGHSMGTLVAALYAHRVGSAISGLVLAAGPWQLTKSPGMWLRALAAVGSTLLPRHTLSPNFDPALLSHDPEAQAAHRSDPLAQSALSLRLAVELLRARDRVLKLAPEITVPTLVLHGELDPIADAEGSRHLFDLLGSQDKELRTYPSSRHELHNELPDRRNAMLADLLWWLDCHRD